MIGFQKPDSIDPDHRWILRSVSLQVIFTALIGVFWLPRPEEHSRVERFDEIFKLPAVEEFDIALVERGLIA